MRVCHSAGRLYQCACSVVVRSFHTGTSICDRWSSERPHEATCPMPNRLYSGDICTAAKEFDPIGVDYMSGGHGNKPEVRDWQHFACLLKKVCRVATIG